MITYCIVKKARDLYATIYQVGNQFSLCTTWYKIMLIKILI